MQHMMNNLISFMVMLKNKNERKKQRRKTVIRVIIIIIKFLKYQENVEMRLNSSFVRCCYRTASRNSTLRVGYKTNYVGKEVGKM